MEFVARFTSSFSVENYRENAAQLLRSANMGFFVVLGAKHIVYWLINTAEFVYHYFRNDDVRPILTGVIRFLVYGVTPY